MKALFKPYKLKSILALFMFIVLFGACSDDDDNNPNNGDGKLNFKFVVFSDPHILAQSLATTGDPWEEYVEQGRKLLQESEAIMQSLTNSIIASDANIVLVPGDLTMDGQKKSLEKMADFLKQIENAGKKVFIVPGNHDINNFLAADYSGSTPIPTDKISVSEFETLMADFGYSEAFARDPNSLSYIVEPIDGMVIIALDGCRYDENFSGEESVIGGKLKPETVTWAKSQMDLAKAEGKLIFGMMHHGLVEHFSKQSVFPISSEYVIEDWQQLAAEFSGSGMKAIFTGHFHANDIVKYENNGNWIFDVETGSAISAPCPWRICSVTNSETLNISTNHISSINYDLGGQDFQMYASEGMLDGMNSLAMYVLIFEYAIDPETASQLAPLIASAWLAHYNGNEAIDAQTQAVIDALNQSGDSTQMLLASMLQSLYTDLPPADNNLTINLITGAVN